MNSVSTTFSSENAQIDDVNGIAELLKQYADMGNLLPRSAADIEKNIADFKVIRDSKKQVIACGALEQFTDELIEIRSLVVDPTIQGKGLGKIIVNDLIKTAKARGAKRLMALTYSVGFFNKLGFEVVDKKIFPEKVWSICVNCYKFNNCDETAVLLHL